MPRDLTPRDSRRKAAARTQFALDRRDLKQAPTPRKPASGPVSHAVKVMPPDIEAALAVFRASRPKGD